MAGTALPGRHYRGRLQQRADNSLTGPARRRTSELTATFADEAAYEIPEQAIADDRGRARVIWRMPGAASPPLYPVGVADMAAQGPAS
jgi:hypothetical protein